MKRLVFCFDGTWNKLEPTLATNVVLTAASILRTDAKGVSQVIHYDEGVGTGDLDAMRGGMFGTGLIDNVSRSLPLSHLQLRSRRRDLRVRFFAWRL